MRTYSFLVLEQKHKKGSLARSQDRFLLSSHLDCNTKTVLKQKNPIKVAAVGDIGLYGAVADNINAKEASWAFSAVETVLDQADVVFGNLEIPFADETMLPAFAEVPSRLRSDPACVPALEYGKFDVLSLANNHIMDFGQRGLELTIKLLDHNGINSTGAGLNRHLARKPAIVTRKGIQVGFLAYTKKGPFCAKPQTSGPAPIERHIIEQDVKSLRPEVDWIIVSLHFGMMYTDYPTQRDTSLAHSLIDCGVDVVLGHHPHVLQGVEEYSRGIIAYSLGEFLFDPFVGNVIAHEVAKIRRQSIILMINLEQDSVRVEAIPIMIGRDCRPSVAQGINADEILMRLRKISEPLGRYSINFAEHLAARSVKHNLRVIWFNLIHFNWRYLARRSTRIRLLHVKVLFKYFEKIIKQLNDDLG